MPSKRSKPRNVALPHPNGTKLALLALLAEYFCLRTNDAAELLRRRPMTPSDARSVRRTLAILHGDGFLHRAPYVGLNQERGGITYVYGLSAKGVRHAFQSGYATEATKTLDEHSHRTLDHELEISAFHAALHGLCSDRSVDYTWRQTSLKHAIHPDALFSVANPAHPNQVFSLLSGNRALEARAVSRWRAANPPEAPRVL